MYVERLKLRNVRRFEEAEFFFRPGFNLLVGENGLGKTTALRALLAATGKKEFYNGGLGLSGADVKLGSDNLQVVVEMHDKAGLKRKLQYSRGIVSPPSRHGNRSNVVTLFYRSNEALSRNLKSRKRREIRSDSPIISGQLEEFLHRTEHSTNFDIKPEMRFGRSREIRSLVVDALAKMSKRFRRFHWRFEACECLLNNTSKENDRSVNLLLKALSNSILRTFQLNPRILADVDQRSISIDAGGFIIGGSKNNRVLPRFEQLASTSLGPITSSQRRLIDSCIAEIKMTPRIVVLTDEGELPLGQLSDGEQRMFSLFVDIARILSIHSTTSIRESSAIVLIDEIDVHLHPKWQRAVVPLLEDIFPACQFIATTHSPFVIQAVDRHKVMQVTEQGSEDSEMAGNSIEDIIEEVQGIDMPQRSKRAEELDQTAERYFTLLRDEGADRQKLKDAERAYRRASQPFASNPALEALLRVEKLQAEEA